MDYKYIYDQLVLRCKNREKPNSYTERHHILPRCMQGNDTEDNLVFLTAKEHFVAHHLLCKIYPHNPKLWFAFNAMVHWKSRNTNGRTNAVKLSATEYEHLKIRRSTLIAEALKGRPKTAETKEKLRIASTGKVKSPETIQKLSASQKKVKHTAEWNKKVSEGLKKYKCTPEHGRHISEAKKGKHINYNMNSAKNFQNQGGVNNLQAIKYYIDGELIGCQKETILWLAERIGISHGSRKWIKILTFIKEHNCNISLAEVQQFVKEHLR